MDLPFPHSAFFRSTESRIRPIPSLSLHFSPFLCLETPVCVCRDTYDSQNVLEHFMVAFMINITHLTLMDCRGG